MGRNADAASASSPMRTSGLAVLFSALFAPDIVTHSYLGDHATVPTGVAVALFAAIATWPIAWFGFKKPK